MNKDKVFKIIFYISFIPYIVLLLISSYYAISGYDVYTWILPEYVKTIYGMEAFLEMLIWNGLRLCYIPVLPICLIFQIIYVIAKLIKKSRIDQ